MKERGTAGCMAKTGVAAPRKPDQCSFVFSSHFLDSLVSILVNLVITIPWADERKRDVITHTSYHPLPNCSSATGSWERGQFWDFISIMLLGSKKFPQGYIKFKNEIFVRRYQYRNLEHTCSTLQTNRQSEGSIQSPIPESARCSSSFSKSSMGPRKTACEVSGHLEQNHSESAVS